ncbi:MAG: universal stress protein [Cyanobacteria bacterium CRU_2_1]|nr:universal stress protein [Cyanobacteria bacterium RU_5_0]NJR58407.1 universal stress protein [Cyanobacteria bacterium CRU_2_1]
MFNRVLVALDISERDKEVFETALSIAKTHAARLMLMYVLPASEVAPRSPDQPEEEAIVSSIPGELRVRSLEMLRSLHATTKSANIHADFAQMHGEPGETICQLAGSWGADLIVMGHRGLTEAEESAFGGVGNYVRYHAPCSVQMVQDHGHVRQGYAYHA